MPWPRRSAASVAFRLKLSGSAGQRFRRPFNRRVFGFFGGRFDVDGDHVLGKAREQPRLHQRRLTAPAWPVDESHGERAVGVLLFDPSFPEPQAVGQPVAVPWPRQQLEEEVGIVGVKGAQSFRHDLDGLVVRGGRGRRGRGRTGSPGCQRRGWWYDRRGRTKADPSGIRAGLLVEGLLGQKVPQVVGQILGRHVPFGSPFRHRLETDPFQLLRNAFIHLTQRTRFVGGNLIHNFGLRVASERLPSGQQFVEDDAQAEDVAAAIDPMPFAPCLFGTHVGRRPGVPWPLAHVLLSQGQPEVCDERFVALVEQEVAGLDVPMHQTLLVGEMECLGHRRHHFDRFVLRRSGKTLPQHEDVERVDARRFKTNIRGHFAGRDSCATPGESSRSLAANFWPQRVFASSTQSCSPVVSV